MTYCPRKPIESIDANETKLVSVSSVSGGKTSAYMALNYPTDHYVFALVLIDHEPSTPKDKGLTREIQNRIPWFVASAEADLTLANVLRLEQELGREIDWVASEYTFDDLICRKKMLPNSRVRFCTEELKIKPIFWHCYLNYYSGNPILMNIGYRADEKKRVENWNCDKEKMFFPSRCDLRSKRHRHAEISWRLTDFPLYFDQIDHGIVRSFWERKGWKFPEVSNCRFCFNHTTKQQKIQAQREPENLQWWLEKESFVGKSFGETTLTEILTNPLLPIYAEEDISPSCFCTD